MPENYRRLFSYLRPFAGLFGLGLVLTVISAVFDVFSVVLVIPFLQTLFDTGPILAGPTSSVVERILDSTIGGWVRAPDPLDTLRNVVLLVLVALVLKNTLLFGGRYCAVSVRESVERKMREDVFGHLQLLPLGFFGRMKVGQVIARVLTDTKQAREVVSLTLMDVFRKLVTTVFYFVTLLLLSWRLTLITLILAPLLVGVIAPLLRRLRKGFRKAFDEQGEMLSVLQETVSGIRLVKSYGGEEQEKARFGERSRRYARRMVRTEALSQLASPLSEVLSSLVALALIWVGARMVLDAGSLQPEQFIAFVALALQLISPVKAVADFPAKLQISVAAADRFFEVLDEPPEPESGTREASRPQSAVRFENVDFAYEPGRPVLSEIELEVRPGQVIALVGPSGAGKSTFVDLLPRFVDPTRGRVALDGVDLRAFSLGSLRRLFGIVSQDTVIFHDTVRANIAYGDRERWTEEEIRAAARAANAEEFIDALPEGFDTQLGDRGVRLSGGQRQRIGIARAILRDPPILILDEATSSLDTESEQAIQRALAALFAGRTVFVIAHRLSTVHGADRILVLEDGRIVERGTHAELYELGGTYRRLHDLQFATPPQAAGTGSGPAA